jgi:outer membrane protein assembly factor BamB
MNRRRRCQRHLRHTTVRAMVMAIAIGAGICSLGGAWAADWNQFRGPAGDGRHGDAQLPVAWSESENILWKVPIAGKAWSSPVVADGVVWMTNATADGKQLSLVGLEAASGEVLRELTLFEIAEPAFCHDFNSYASPTPVIDGDRLWAHFGSPGTACVDVRTGEVLWSRQDLPCDHHRGAGSSPILVDGLLVLTFDGFDRQYVAALDAATGKTVWEADRNIDYGTDDGDMKKAYSTPLAFEHNGRKQLVSPSAVATIAYDPASGAELWRVMHGGFNAACRPLYVDGLVVICIQRGDALLAVRPEGTGDITGSQVVWRAGKAAPTRPSQCVVDGNLYMVSDTGIFSCLDLATGEPRWTERRSGRFSASLIEAGGKVVAFDEDGGCVVFAANPEQFELLGENTLEAGCMASPAVIDNDLIVRTKTHCYRIHGG